MWRCVSAWYLVSLDVDLSGAQTQRPHSAVPPEGGEGQISHMTPPSTMTI